MTPDRPNRSAWVCRSLAASAAGLILAAAPAGGQNSAESDITCLGGEAPNIAYANYQAADIRADGNSVELAAFMVRDGGGDGSDADALGTTVTAITFNIENHAQLRRLALYDTLGTELAESDAAGSVTFAGLSVTAPDGPAGAVVILRASFMAAVTDNQSVRFTIAAVSANAAGSQFAAADGGAAASSTDGDRNRIEVATTRLAVTGQPSAVGVGSNFTLSVAARDENDNTDLDAAAQVTLSLVSGPGALSAPTGLTRALSGGVCAWPDLRVSAWGDYRLSAGADGLAAAETDLFCAYVRREGFESDGEGSRYTVANGRDQKNQFFKRGRDGDFVTMAALSGEEGTWYVAGENTDVTCAVSLASTDVSHHRNLQVRLALAATANNAFESGGGVNGDFILLLTRLDAGPWVTNGAFRGAGSSASALRRDTDGDAVGDGEELGPTFRDFTFPVAGLGTSLQVRVVFRTTGDGEEAAFDDLRVLGESMDRDSAVLAPAQPVPAAWLPSTADTEAEAVEVLRFRLCDRASADPEPTHVERLTLARGPDDTTDWTDAIQDVRLHDGSGYVLLDNVSVTDASLTLTPLAGALRIANGATNAMALAVYLKSTGLVDRARFQVRIAAVSHGFAAATNGGSRFAAAFAADVVSAIHTVRVSATRLVFAPGLPGAAAGVNRAFAVEVRALDANGNRARAAAGTVALSKESGPGAVSSASGLATALAGGTNRWTDVTLSEPGVVTLRAESAGLAPAVSDPIVAGNVWINEVDYSLPGSDTNEWVELAGHAGVSLAGYELAFINSEGAVYATRTLSACGWTFRDETNGFGFFVIGSVPASDGVADYCPAGWDANEIQNGICDSVQLRRTGPACNVHLLDYAGANPNTEDDQTTALADSAAAHSTLYLQGGPGGDFSAFEWANLPGKATPGAINAGQSLAAPAAVAPAIAADAGVTAVGCSSAALNGELTAGYPMPQVFVCWGRSDGGMSGTSGWERATALGPRAWGAFAAAVTGLTASSAYFYRCCASNSGGRAWSGANRFTTLGPPDLARWAAYVDDVGIAMRAPRSVDSDGDGLSDAWERAYLGGLAASAGAGDGDGDGWTDRQEYLAGTHPGDGSSHLRIASLEVGAGASSDVVLRIAGGNFSGPSALDEAGDGIRRSFQVLASDGDPLDPPRLAGTADDGLSGTNGFTDAGATDRCARRFYRVGVTMAGASYTNAEEWAMHVQQRPPGRRFLVCVPVSLGGGAANNLRGALGRQLALGLHAGDPADTARCDRVEFMDDARNWREAFLAADGAGGRYWWDPDTGRTADVPVRAGMPLWVVRCALAAPRTNAVFTGRSFREDETVNVTFATSGGGWTLFGWPLSRARPHRNLGEATPAGQLGFEDRGVGGTHPELAGRTGDQIWVWDGNRWAARYWLMHTHGAAGGSRYNGRWWDSHAGAFADFSLEPGRAYYYHHPTNWGATAFVWRARSP